MKLGFKNPVGTYNEEVTGLFCFATVHLVCLFRCFLSKGIGLADVIGVPEDQLYTYSQLLQKVVKVLIWMSDCVWWEACRVVIETH